MGRKKKETKTASELLTELENNSEFQSRRTIRERQRRESEEALHLEELPLLRDLSRVGIEVESVWDLVNSSEQYAAAIPVLLEHLRRPYSSKILAGIARAVAVPEARDAWDDLVSLYRNEMDEHLKEALAVAVAAIADDSVMEELVALIMDSKQGPSRVLLMNTMQDARACLSDEAIRKLTRDPDLGTIATRLLKRTK